MNMRNVWLAACVFAACAWTGCGDDTTAFGDFFPLDVGADASADDVAADAEGGLDPQDGGAEDGGAEDGGAEDGGAEDGGAEDGGAEDGGAGDTGAGDTGAGDVAVDARCADGAFRCNGALVETCAGGAWVRAVDCGAGVCVEGPEGPSCEALACTPGSTECEGDVVLACNESGTALTRIDCATLPACAGEAFGCACSEGTCSPRVCAPLERRCVGDEVRACDATGRDEVAVETCSGGTICIDGRCEVDACTVGDARCSGETLVRCTIGGTFEEIDCAASAGYCQENALGARCVDQLCAPGDRACAGEGGSVLVCSARGDAWESVPCGAEQYCAGGACLDRVCEPNERLCVSGDAYQCTSDGSTRELVDRCDGETCVDGFCLGEGECRGTADCPVPDAYCSGDVRVYYTSGFGRCRSGECDFSLAIADFDCAAIGEVCDPSIAACVPPECEGPGECGAGFCVDNRCVECTTRSDCRSDAWCDAAGACQPCACPSDALCASDGSCVDGDPLDCRSDGECQGLAAALGFANSDDAACDGRVGCYIKGLCDDPVGGLPFGDPQDDPFDASCSPGTECTWILDLLGTSSFPACGGCETNADCRDGETCNVPLLGLSVNYCEAGGGGFLP